MIKYLAELHPEPRLVVDVPPPKATKIWCISEHGTGFASHWHPEYGIVAWCPLPKMTPEQKRRLKTMREMNINPTVYNPENAHESSEL